MAELIHESLTTVLERSASTGRWKATLITPGKGSSGFYGEAMLRENTDVFNGLPVKNYFMHPKEPGAQRDPRDQWGYLEPGTAKYEEGLGVTAEINVLEHWRPVVESLAKAGQAPLSVYMSAEKDSEGNITALYPHVKNSVDLVDYPGRPGSALTEQLLESARAGADHKPAAASAEEKEGKHMLDKETQDAIKAAVAEALAPVLTAITENTKAAKADVQAEANADAVATAVSEALAGFEERIKAIKAVESLSAKQVEVLTAEAKTADDESFTRALEDAKAVAEEFTNKITESNDDIVTGHGRVVEGAAGDFDFAIHGFGGLD